MCQQRIDSTQYRFDRPEPERQIVVHAGSSRIVGSGRPENVEMVADSIVQTAKCAVMEKRRLQPGIAQR